MTAMRFRRLAMEAIRKHGISIGIELFINFAAPFAIYHLTAGRLGEVRGLLAASAPPIVWSIVEIIHRRRIDAISMLVLAGIALSLLGFVGADSARLLELRGKLGTGLIGLVFLGSAAIGKPVIYQIARAIRLRRSATELASFEALRDNTHVRQAAMVITLAWGIGLTAEAALAIFLAYSLPAHAYLLVSPILGYGIFAVLGLWTFWFSRHQGTKVDAEKAVESNIA